MSIQSEINRIKSGVSAAYSAVQDKGGTLPDVQNSANLAAAVQSIPTSIIPPGFIAMWFGPDSTIPPGWVLCNGQNGTPDLRDRFIVGAGNKYIAGDTGGSETVTLTKNQIPKHNHSYSQTQGTSKSINWGAGGNWNNVLGDPQISDSNTGNAGKTEAHENRPPYHALCFIMKQ